jgi:ribosome-binding protein aMBF1 (putative translation factor)
MFHQDWEPIVIRKPKPPPAPPQNKEKSVGLEEKRIKVYSKELADAVMNGRLALKISQAELAKRCHVVPGVIQEIETRKGIYDAELINKVLKVLKIQNVTRRYVEN